MEKHISKKTGDSNSVKSKSIKSKGGKSQSQMDRNEGMRSLEQIEEFKGFSRSGKELKSQCGSSQAKSSKKKLALKLTAKKKLVELEMQKKIIEMELLQLSLSGSESSVTSHSEKIEENINKEVGNYNHLKSIREESDLQKVNSWLEKNKDNLEKESQNKSESASQCSDNKKRDKEGVNRYEDKLEKILLRQTIDQELPIFTGNIREWCSFYNQYIYTTKVLDLSEEENMCRLRKYLKGEARRSVEGLLTSITSAASSIITVLKNKYGRPDVIIRNLVSEANNITPIKSHDFSALISFSETVTNLVVTLESLDMQNYLSCPQLLDELMRKIPYNMQLSWGEKVSRNNGQYSLKDFQKWITEKAEGCSYVQGINNKAQNVEKSRRTLLVSSDKTQKNFVKRCIICEEKHELEKCPIFLEKTIDRRWKFVKERNLCFCCMKGSHKISECKRKKTCDISSCKKVHHKLLHFTKEIKTAGVNARNDNLASTQETIEQEKVENAGNSLKGDCVAHMLKNNYNEVLLKIAPVILKNGNIDIKTFALFDEGSTVSLIDEELANELDLNGSETVLNLRWTDKNTNKRLLSRRTKFKISGEPENDFYQMSDVYTVKDIHLPVQQINIKHMLNKWKHLQTVRITNLEQAQPRILLGQDHWELITTRKLIEGPKNSPALSYTKLGWIVHGNSGQFRGRIDETISLHIKNNDRDEEKREREEKKKR